MESGTMLWLMGIACLPVIIRNNRNQIVEIVIIVQDDNDTG